MIEVLDRTDLDRLLKTCSRRAPSGLRDRALLALLYGSGLRISEALTLRTRDVNLQECTVRVHRGKGGRPRVCGLEAGSAEMVRAWVGVRAGLDVQPGAPLICQITVGRIGRAVQPACVRQMLARRRARAGIEKRVHAHGFRHSHAANMAALSLPLNLIQKQLGHANVSTTSRYIDHVRPQDVIDAVREMG